MRSIFTVVITSLLVVSAVFADVSQSDQNDPAMYAAAGINDRQFSIEGVDIPSDKGRSVALLSVSNVSSAAAVISWASSTPTMSRVEYGLSMGSGLSQARQ